MFDTLILCAQIDAVALILAALFALVWENTEQPDTLDNKLLGVAAGLWRWHVRILLAPYRWVCRLHHYLETNGSNVWRIH